MILNKPFEETLPPKDKKGNEIVSRVNSLNLSESLLPLSPVSTSIAQAFYMNNYEVNLIFSKFIKLWNKTPDIPYVRITTLISNYKFYETSLVDKFFPNGRVYYNQYFQFVTILLLFKYKQLIHLMLSVCKIHSNVVITLEQMKEFLNAFDKERKIDLINFFEFCSANNIKNNLNTFPLKTFIEFINQNSYFQSIFLVTRYIIFSEVFPEKRQQIILKRYNYYTTIKKQCKSIIIDKPIISKESCINKFCRLIKNEPHPDYFDYVISYSNLDFATSTDYIETLVFIIRKAYGYAYRTSRSSKQKMKLHKSASCLSQSYFSNHSDSPNVSPHDVSRENYSLGIRRGFNIKQKVSKSFQAGNFKHPMNTNSIDHTLK